MDARGWFPTIAMVAAAAGPARAEDRLLAELPRATDSTAKARIIAGNALYRAGDYAHAAMEFSAGLEREDLAILRYNLGQCYRKLGWYAEAVEAYRQLLAHPGLNPALVARVEGFIADAEKLRPPPAEAPPVAAPAPAPAPAPVAAPPLAMPAIVSPPPVPTLIAPPLPPRDVARGHRTLGWTLSAAGLGAMGLGAYLLVNAHAIDDDGNHESKQSASVALHDRASEQRAAGALFGAAGLGAATVGLVLLLRHRGEPEQSAWRVGIRGDGIAVSGRF